MLCKYAKRTDQYHGWECSISDGECMYLTPNQARCAEEFGECEPPNKKESDKQC